MDLAGRCPLNADCSLEENAKAKFCRGYAFTNDGSGSNGSGGSGSNGGDQNCDPASVVPGLYFVYESFVLVASRHFVAALSLV